jgi:hypothetical protein
MRGMSPDLVFVLATYGVLPAWGLLICAPQWRWTQRLVHAIWIPLLFALAFAWAFTHPPAWPPGGSFFTLRGVMILFDDPHLALAAWLHVTVFDLFVGAWVARDAIRCGIAHWSVVPCLLAALVLGPLGLALYLVIRFAWRQRLTLIET